jgi:hypothetical protein
MRGWHRKPRDTADRRPLWMRLILACVLGSLLLSALYTWGLRGYVDQRRGVRDAQYQRTQRELERQQDQIDRLEQGQAENERRLGELERRLHVTPSPSPSLWTPRGSATSGAVTVPTVQRTSRAASSPRAPARPSAKPSPIPAPSTPPADDTDLPLLCLPLVGCLL